MDTASKGKDKLKNTKENFQRKPSWKTRIPPPVRQTLTSYKRMLIANPLMKYQEAGIDIDALFKSRPHGSKLGEISDILDFKASTLEGRPSLRELRKPETKLIPKKLLELPKTNKRPQFITSGNTAKSLAKPIVDNTSKYSGGNKVECKKPLGEIKAKVDSFLKNSRLKPAAQVVATKPESKGLSKMKTSSLRRSLSAGHIQNKTGKTFDSKQAYTKSNRSHSEENVNGQTTSNVLGFSPILAGSVGSRTLIFITPSAYERQSICNFTPRSGRKSSYFRASTPAPVELLKPQEGLTKWLKSRGKPLASFYHLSCFGIDEIKKTPSPEQIDDENKENIEVIEEKSPSYEDLKITRTPEPRASNIALTKKDIPKEALAKVAKEAIIELQKLIEEDYPRAQCRAWLELIREKYKEAVDEPEYWECRAAIEQSLGNVGNAFEFYKTAIIQGAEVTAVDKSPDQLMKKFSLLSISPSATEQNKFDGNKERIVREARTVFKSTIIQFAIQEKKLKKKGNDEASVAQNGTRLVATPVRRSTRMSRSAYVSTPGVMLCTSLKEISLSTEAIKFEKNQALC